MARVRALWMLAALVPMARMAHAQPVDPYKEPAPVPSPAPSTPSPVAPAAPADTPQDPYAPAPASPAPGPPAPVSPAPVDLVLAERIAESLVARAQELLEARAFLDAKQLAVEALVGSPRGPAAERARAILHTVNQALGIPEDSTRSAPPPASPPTKPPEDVDTSPIQDPTLSSPPVALPAEGGLGSRANGRGVKIAASVHGGLYAGLLGTTIGSFLSSDAPAEGAVPAGLVVGLAGGLAAPSLVGKLGWTEARIRTVGSATLWGGVIGGLFGDIGKLSGTTAREVLVAASVGSTVAGLGGYALARGGALTRGDIALIDTLAGIGGVGGLTIGMVMQPAESEAYSLNSVIGIAGGVLVGYIAAPKTHTTPRRMLRVAGLAAAGGAAPLLLYAAIQSPTTTADERVAGVLSSAGLVLGAYLGVRWTSGMDEGLDTPDGKPARDADDAPIALIGRSSSGRWGLGGLGIQALSPALAPQRGMALELVGGAF